VILCQVTSNPYADPSAVTLSQADFASGSLQRTSYARPGKLFTAHESLVVKTPGVLRAEAHSRVVDRVVEAIRNG
jgi:mRNA interferase MazF